MRALGNLENPSGFAPEGRPGRLNGADPALREQVDRWRAMGASWDAIGRMLRRSGPDVRAAFDGSYLRAVVPAAAAKSKPPVAAPVTLSAGIAGAELETLRALIQRQRLLRELVELHGLAAPTVRGRIVRLKEAGLIRRCSNGTWAATRSGRIAAALRGIG